MDKKLKAVRSSNAIPDQMRPLGGCGELRPPQHAMPADGVELARLLGNLAELVRMLADVTTLEQLLEIACEHVRVGLRSATVSLSRLEPGTTTLRTLINVGDLGPN